MIKNQRIFFDPKISKLQMIAAFRKIDEIEKQQPKIKRRYLLVEDGGRSVRVSSFRRGQIKAEARRKNESIESVILSHIDNRK